jgi:diacylglycerol kinase (ATP)
VDERRPRGAGPAGAGREPRRSGLGLAARAASFRYAGRGLRSLVASQPNARVHAAATLAAVALALALGLSRLEWCALVLAIGLVWVAEALNTAIEQLCDLVSREAHPLVAGAKDLAAGGVLAAALAAAGVGALVFAPRLWQAWLGR